MGANKYQLGPVIQDLTQLCQILDDGSYVMYLNKPLHPSFVSRWSLFVVRQYLEYGLLHEAIKTKKGDRCLAQISILR